MVAGVLLELGLAKLLIGVSDATPLYLVVLVAADASRRRFRVEARIRERVRMTVTEALTKASSDSSHLYALVSPSSLPVAARRIVEYVVAVDGKPRIAIATTFQTHSGGRQTRDMSTLYPGVQTTLRASGITLVLVADGQGMRGLSERVLAELLRSIPHTMSLAQAEQGRLSEAFVALADLPPETGLDTPALHKLIQSAIEHGPQATAATLPVSDSAARLSLATYASTNRHLGLKLSPDGASLSWGRGALVARLRALRAHFQEAEAISGFGELLGAVAVQSSVGAPADGVSLFSLTDDAVLNEPFAIGARTGKADPELLRDLVKTALQLAPKSRFAVLVVSEPIGEDTTQRLRDAQAFLPVTVVVVDVETCLAMAQSSEAPRDRLRWLMLEQTDLTKLSPFVVRGVTPARVFFGREEEEATLISTLSTNSVALLGGRRIGKTSLMQHSFQRLDSANLRPYFGDCQVVRTWADFGVMATRNWGIKVPERFKPQHLFSLVNELKGNSALPIVILLDEIDQLLDWDTAHSEDEVPEGFFRACRSISQQGLAQFVFSGERTIATRIWDATSPHWNFCRPLMLRQLTRSAATSLMIEPMEALGVRIDDADEFVEASWNSTDGHPELLQFLGDKIVSRINSRTRADVYASTIDVLEITNQFEYAEQYLETYWGQATPLERILSILLLPGPQSIDQLHLSIDIIAPQSAKSGIHGALRMLELYGIAEQFDGGYKLRAAWFNTALNYYGGGDAAVSRYLKNIST
jgi:hypothetical protein